MPELTVYVLDENSTPIEQVPFTSPQFVGTDVPDSRPGAFFNINGAIVLVKYGSAQ